MLRRTQQSNKEKSDELLYNITFTIWKGLPDNFFADEDQTWGNKDVVLEIDTENTMDRANEKHVRFN